MLLWKDKGTMNEDQISQKHKCTVNCNDVFWVVRWIESVALGFIAMDKLTPMRQLLDILRTFSSLRMLSARVLF